MRTTPGTAFIDLAVANGAPMRAIFVVGLEGQVGSVTVSAAATGFSGATSGIINVVTPAVSLLSSPPTSTTALSTNSTFAVYIGVPSDDGTTLRYQNFYGYCAADPSGRQCAHGDDNEQHAKRRLDQHA